jgi:ABC-type polysaccharide/polyol phosphate export permease
MRVPRHYLGTLTYSSRLTSVALREVLRAFAEHNPFTITVDAMRALWIGAPAGDSIWGAVAWSVGIAAFFSFLSVRRYRRAITR